MSLFNGENHTALRNGYVDYETISCNGFHETDVLEASPERTVGYGRSRSQPYSKRSHSWSDPSSDNEDRFCHLGWQNVMVCNKNH